MDEREKQIEALERGVGDEGGESAPAEEAGAEETVAPLVNVPPQQGMPGTPLAQRPTGRRYGFLCTYCSSRLEATESMAGQSGTCPTCGNAIVIPILDSRGRLIDPTSGLVIKQDPHPVHAYAAAGHKAPQIVTEERTGERHILCPRCHRQNALSSNNCMGCGLPFTMEGTAGDSVSGTNTWAVASLVLGIVSMAGGCFFVIPTVLAIVFGLLAFRTTNQATGRSSGRGMAIAGLILGALGLVAGGLFWANIIRR